MPFRVINNHRQPITLESGLILAAAGTPGSTREVESVTEKDRRRNAGRINVIEILLPEASVEDLTLTKPLDADRPGVTESEPGDTEVRPSRRRN